MLGSIGPPTPDTLAVGLELRVQEGPLEPPRLHRAAGDLKIDLHVHVGRTRMLEGALCAEQLWDKATEHYELGATAVVMDHANERPLCGAPRGPATLSLFGHS